MLKDIPTMNDFEFKGKTVLLRIDINTPMDPKTRELLDDRRFRSHKETIKELVSKGAKVVAMAHQGRPGDPDFTTLEKHAVRLSEVVGRKVKYVDSIFSSYALNEIKKMDAGEILLLENVRFYSEEVLDKPADAQAKTFLVEKLSSVADVYVNDAFSTAHRSQPSLVGFPVVLPSVAGRLMEKEIKTIDDVLKNPKKPVAFVLGGTKADDSLKAIEKALANGIDYILTGGLVANIFLAAKNYRIGDPNIEFIRGKKMIEQIDVAKDLLEKYEENIILPVDLAVDQGGIRTEILVSNLPTRFAIKDIGSQTIEKYMDIIKGCGTIYAKGALGLFEDKNFAIGTTGVMKAVADSDSYAIVGGGHLVAAARDLDLEHKITHISSGGGASISLLAGYKLPAVEILRKK
ncbi:MAG: phosphoglycerate kinase [Candidatus Altiarchaeota archaeon]|nr:phosphoglycerate kinase [Candidatus Altiarchaeota archaeon]